jgi:hypothetical protein
MKQPPRGGGRFDSYLGHETTRGVVQEGSIMSESTMVREFVVRGSHLPTGLVTPFKAHKVVNAILEEAGVKPIVPQYLYSLTTSRLRDNKTPKIAGEVVNVDGKEQYQVSPEGIAEWVIGYLDRKGVKAVGEAATDPRDEVDEAYLPGADEN